MEKNILESNDTTYKLINKRNNGKIIRGKVFNAYNKQSLSTIPSKIENILIRDKSFEQVNGFNVKAERFPVLVKENKLTLDDKRNKDLIEDERNNKEKDKENSYMTETKYSDNVLEGDENYSVEHNKELSLIYNDKYKGSPVFFYNKKYEKDTNYLEPPKNGFIKHTFNYKLNPLVNHLDKFSSREIISRFDSLSEEQSKYLPGPGNYNKIDLIKANNKYSSLFYTNNTNKIQHSSDKSSQINFKNLESTRSENNLYLVNKSLYDSLDENFKKSLKINNSDKVLLDKIELIKLKNKAEEKTHSSEFENTNISSKRNEIFNNEINEEFMYKEKDNVIDVKDINNEEKNLNKVRHERILEKSRKIKEFNNSNLGPGHYCNSIFDNSFKIKDPTKISRIFFKESFNDTINRISNVKNEEIKFKKITDYVIKKEMGLPYIEPDKSPIVGKYYFKSFTDEDKGFTIQKLKPNQFSNKDEKLSKIEINNLREKRILNEQQRKLNKIYKKFISGGRSFINGSSIRFNNSDNHIPGPAYYYNY